MSSAGGRGVTSFNQSQNMSNESKELTVRPQEETIHSMLSIVERAAKDPTVDIDKMERLLAMAERMQMRGAEQSFNAAFTKMQGELPVIVATSVIPNRGKYERYEDVWRQVEPALTSNGFSVAYKQQADDKRITMTCILSHSMGHSRETPFSVRLGGKADSDTQADCKASTTAKRNALLAALNVVIRQDVFQDEGDPHNDNHERVTQEQADTLRDLCDETKSNRTNFLAWATGAEGGKFEDIPAVKFDAAISLLNRKKAPR